jgi:hypothetical protein
MVNVPAKARRGGRGCHYNQERTANGLHKLDELMKEAIRHFREIRWPSVSTRFLLMRGISAFPAEPHARNKPLGKPK